MSELDTVIAQLGLERDEAWHLSRRLSQRAGKRARTRLGPVRERLESVGLDPEAASDGALLLLALGLRESGMDHAGVARCLRALADDVDATQAAFRSAHLCRASGAETQLDEEAAAAVRRRAGAMVFLAFLVWGMLGVQIFSRLG